WVVYPADDPAVAPLVDGARGQPVTFADQAHPGERTLYVDADQLRAYWDGQPIDLGPVRALRIPGAHNRRNALAAAGAALGVGVGADAIRAGIAGFGGVAHRLEAVATVDGVAYVNDSAATTPEAAAAALAAFAGRPIVAISGGSDKGLDLAPLAAA